MNKLKLIIRDKILIINLKQTNTSSIILNSIPIISYMKTWGEEIYFDTNLNVKLEKNSKSVVNKGEIAFWTEGKSIAIGYGPTPMSKNQEIRLVAPCNIWGTADFEKSFFDEFKDGDKVILDKL